MPRRKASESFPEIDPEILKTLTPDQERELRKALLEIEQRKKYRTIDFFQPYPKQLEFFKEGPLATTRLFSAAPQTGKTVAGAFEAACHATGLYPDWWPGYRFTEPNDGWIGGITGELVRDNCQAKLFGQPGIPESLGTGYIPKSGIDPKRLSLAHGYQGLYDTAYVLHVSGGWSSIGFKTYSQGREKWQSRTLRWIWMDEESDMDIQNEAENRVRATDGILWTTYTPKKGRTPLTLYLTRKSDHNSVVKMSIYDCPHISPETRKFIEDTTPSYLAPAVIWGEPGAGEGLVFEVDDKEITEATMREVPAHWPKLWAIDFGGSAASKEGAHPFAAVLIAWDKDADVIHVLHTVKMSRAEPMAHAKAMKSFGLDIPVAWPHDGNRGVPGYGGPMARLYKDEGLKMLPTHAAWPDGSIALWPGITEMDQRMKTGKLKVAAHLSDWFSEKRNYCMENHEIVKIDDDLMSATRVAIMAKRYAKVSGAQRGLDALGRPKQPRIALGAEGNHWGI